MWCFLFMFKFFEADMRGAKGAFPADFQMSHGPCGYGTRYSNLSSSMRVWCVPKIKIFGALHGVNCGSFQA